MNRECNKVTFMNNIFETENTVVLENDYVKIELSKKDASVIGVTDNRDGKSIMDDEKSYFIGLYNADETLIPSKSLKLSGNTLILDTEVGKIEVSAESFDDHFILEVISEKLPEGAYCVGFGEVKFNYVYNEKNTLLAGGVSMTVNTNPNYFPSGKDKKLLATAFQHLGGVNGAKFGFTVAPRGAFRNALKNICLKIDKQKGLVSMNAGPFSQDFVRSSGDYIIEFDPSPEYLARNLDFYNKLGVDQIDYHKGSRTTRQGDFKQMSYANNAEFRKNVADVLKANGMECGLHTYAFYIDPSCNEFLAQRRVRDMLATSEVFTLSEDVSAEDVEFSIEESILDLSTYYGFFSKDMPYAIIGDEIIYFGIDKNKDNRLTGVGRGYCGTTASTHKKGEKIYRILGYFNEFAPKLDSELYYEVAHLTARTYNEGGYTMIYLDAIDGLSKTYGTDRNDRWYYGAKFVHEIMRNCEIDPMIEFSDMYPAIWATRARAGAADTPFRAYKNWNYSHHRSLLDSQCNHYGAVLGWYNYYPVTDIYPGNQHTKYHHFDAVDHMGSLAVINNYGTVFRDSKSSYARYAGLRRNIELWRMYSNLRKTRYFSEELLEKLRENDKQEYRIEKKKNGKYVFVEKDYQVKRLYSILEEGRGQTEFTNPYKKQTPFIRIEHCMSTLGKDPFVIYPMNENEPLSSQIRMHEFGCEIDLSEKLAMKVRVKGNGKKGAFAIKTYANTNSEHGYGLYIIETDFEGWRDFVLLEADNGDRPDLNMDLAKPNVYAIFRSGLSMNRMTKVEIVTSGDIEGVQMSSVVACRQVYNVLKNPTVTIGKENVMFECELQSTDFVEWDGKEAKVIDRYGNEKPIWFSGNITAPKGKVKATLSGVSLNNCPVNAYLTLGFTGKEIKE